MSISRNYRWEAAHVTIILGVITTLAVVTHMFGTAQARSQPSATAIPMELRPRLSNGSPGSVRTPRSTRVSSQPTPAHPPTSDPREVVVGPNGINSRYTLVRTDRRSLSSTVDELTVRLHVVSLATANLVSPFSSDMLDVSGRGLEPIDPKKHFHMSIPSCGSQYQDVVFNIPAGLNLENAALYIITTTIGNRFLWIYRPLQIRISRAPICKLSGLRSAP